MKYLFICLLLSLFLLFSCEKEIVIKPLPYENQLTIECILEPNTFPKLYLSNSVPFFDASVTPSQIFARNAFATISGPGGTDNLIADSVFDNFRCRWVPFYKGSILSQTGGNYNLTVTYNGKTYTASTNINQPKVNIQSISYVQVFHDVYGEHEGVVVNFTDASGSLNFYRYQMNRIIDSSVYGASNLGLIHSTCVGANSFFQREIGRTIYTDKNVDGQALTFTVEPAFKHKQNDTSYVFLQSLDEKSAKFYEELDKQKLAQMNPFVEPVFLGSQIDGCIGVFGSMVLSDSVLFVYPE